MPDTVPVIFDLNPDVAAALQDPVTRARVERMIVRTARPASVERLFDAMDAMSATAEQRGVTAELLQQELAAYNAERRGLDAP